MVHQDNSVPPCAKTDNLTKHDHGEKITQREASSRKEYPPMTIVVPTLISACFALFLAALDRTIIGVAVPAISDEFQSFDDIAWYQAAFSLTNCVFQLPMGKFYKFFPAKWNIIINVIIFELGSVICAVSHSSTAFIIGRAVTGIGAAGILVGVQVVLRDVLPLDKRPKFQGLFGLTFGLSSILGPIVGGAFTTNVSWRWCFWINLPIGGLALLGLIFLLPLSPALDQLNGNFLQTAKSFDPIGNLFLFPALVCLLLGLQWGGVQYPWSSARIVALLTIGSVLFVMFILIQFWVQENGTLPPRIIRQRTIAFATINYFGIGACLVVIGFYLPIWFQVVQGVSAGTAGIRLLAYFLSTVIFVIAGGVLVSKIGYYTPPLIIGCALLVVGIGLLTTFHPDIDAGKWIGYQILLGAGLGVVLQQPINAAQTVLSDTDIPTGITVLTFAQLFGGTIIISACQALFSATLTSKLAGIISTFDPAVLTTTGITRIRTAVPSEQIQAVLQAFNQSIIDVFYFALGASILALLASFGVEWRSVKDQPVRHGNTDGDA